MFLFLVRCSFVLLRVNKLRKEEDEEKFEYLLRLKKTSFSYSSSSPPISCRFPFVFRGSTNESFSLKKFFVGNYLPWRLIGARKKKNKRNERVGPKRVVDPLIGAGSN